MSRMLVSAKRAMAGLMAVMMIVTALPSYAFADEIPESTEAAMAEAVGESVETTEGVESQDVTGTVAADEPEQVTESEDIPEDIEESTEVIESSEDIETAAGESEEELLGSPSNFSVEWNEDDSKYTVVPRAGIEDDESNEGHFVISEGAKTISLEITPADDYSITAVTAEINANTINGKNTSGNIWELEAPGDSFDFGISIDIKAVYSGPESDVTFNLTDVEYIKVRKGSASEVKLTPAEGEHTVKIEDVRSDEVIVITEVQGTSDHTCTPPQVTVKKGDVYFQWGPEDDEENNKVKGWTVGTVSEDTTVNVSCIESAHVVYAVDGYSKYTYYNKVKTTLNGSELGSSYTHIPNSAQEIVVTPKDGYEIKVIEYKFGNKTRHTEQPDAEGKVVIPYDVVISDTTELPEVSNYLYINIVTKQPIVFREKEGVTFHKYTEIEINWDGIKTSGGVGEAVTQDTVDYNGSYDFVVELSDELAEEYEIDKVMAGDDVLEPVTEYYYEDADAAEADEETELTHYTCKNVEFRQDIKVLLKPASARLKVEYVEFSYWSAIKEIKVYANGQYYSDINGAYGVAEYVIPKGSDVKLTIVPYEGQNLVSVKEKGKDEPLPVVKGVLSLKLDKDIALTAMTEDVPLLYAGSYPDSMSVYADKSTINVHSKASFDVCVRKGTSLMKITEVTAKIKNKNAPEGFAVLNAEYGIVSIDASKAASAGTTPITLTVKADLGNDKVGTWTLNIVVAQNVESLTLKGLKKGQTEIEQTVGTSVDYTVVCNAGADMDRLKYKVVTEEENCSVTYKDGILSVKTSKNGVLASGKPIKVEFRDVDTDDSAAALASFTIKPVDISKLAAPAVKVVSTTDKDVTLSLALPKGVEKLDNIVYFVKFTSEDADDAVMLKLNNCWIRPYDDHGDLVKTYKVTLAKDGVQLGKKTNYEMTAQLIQVNRAYDHPLDDDNIRKEGDKIKAVKFATKDPAYETKLALEKKAKSVTFGQKNVLLAKAKFTKNTTYTTIGKAYLVAPNGKEVASLSDNLFLDSEGTSLYLWDSSDVEYTDMDQMIYSSSNVPGKYTLYVYPTLPDNTNVKPATMTVTFNSAVAEITHEPDETALRRIYKLPNKSAGLKIVTKIKGTTANDNYMMPDLPRITYKPAKSKLKWFVETKTRDNEALEKAVKVNNGSVTVAKDYVPLENSAYNTFTVYCAATDVIADPTMQDIKDNKVVYASSTFVVCAGSQNPVSMAIKVEGKEAVNGADNNPEEVISTDLDDGIITVMDDLGEKIAPENVTYKVTPKKGMTISRDGTVTVTKVGTYTVKATLADGSKKTLTRKFAVKYDELDAADPFMFGAYVIGSKTGERASLFKDGKTTEEVDEAGLFEVYYKANPAHEGALCKDDLKLDFGKTAKKVKISSAISEYYGQLRLLKPLKDEVKLTVSGSGIESKTYTIKISNAAKGKLIPDKKGYSIYSEENISREFAFGASDIPAITEGNHLQLLYQIPDSIYQAKKLIDFGYMMELTEDLDEGDTRLDTEKGKLTVSYMSMPKISKGTYNMTATLWEMDAENKPVKPLTAPATVKIKVAAVPKTVTEIKTKPAVTVKDAEGAETLLEFKKAKNMLEVESVELLNDNNNGTVSGFSKYFKARGVEKNIVLVRTAEAIPAGVTSITGWIRYTVRGADGKETAEKTEKITVNLRAAEAAP